MKQDNAKPFGMTTAEKVKTKKHDQTNESKPSPPSGGKIHRYKWPGQSDGSKTVPPGAVRMKGFWIG